MRFSDADFAAMLNFTDFSFLFSHLNSLLCENRFRFAMTVVFVGLLKLNIDAVGGGGGIRFVVLMIMWVVLVAIVPRAVNLMPMSLIHTDVHDETDFWFWLP